MKEIPKEELHADLADDADLHGSEPQKPASLRHPRGIPQRY